MEVDDKDSSRKRRRSLEEKLQIGEEVEVLFMDEGFAGSWHTGVIIGSGIDCRHIRFTHLLNDDQQSQHEKWITVSSGITAASSISAQKGYRGNIRPPAPRCGIQISDIKYGVFVDALVNDAWWEGVIFDNENNSSERLIFFPDEGDIQKIAIDQLRLTREWDEVSGCWKPRGKWILLQVLDTINKKEGFIPVSVRQLWYDLRSTEAFQDKIEFWPWGSQHIWHNLVSDIIQELLSVVKASPLPRTGIANLTDASLKHVAKNCSSVFSECIVEFQNRDGALSPCGRRFIDKRCYAESHLLAAGWKLEDNFYVSPEREKYDSFIEAREASVATERNPDVQDIIDNDRWENTIEAKGIKSEGCLESTVEKSWKTVEMQPEYCADVATICASYNKYGRKRVGGQNIQILKKYLLHMGWRIEFKRDPKPRFRYMPPDGDMWYYSLNNVCCDLMDKKYRDADTLDQPQVAKRHKNQTQLSSGNVGQLALEDDASLKIEYLKDCSDMSEVADSECLLNSESSFSSSIKQSMSLTVGCTKEVDDQVYSSEAILKYKELIDNGQRNRDKLLTENAKRHLKLQGWRLQMKDKKTKKELLYTSPNGKNYISLYRACKGFLEECTKGMKTIGPNQFQSDSTAEKSGDIQGDAHISHGSVKEPRLSSANICRSLVQLSSGKVSNNKKKRKEKTTTHFRQCRGSISLFSMHLRSSKRSKLGLTPSSSRHHLSKTILSWLIDKDIILPRQKVTYIRRADGCAMKHGRVTREGIKCSCCVKVYSLANYQAHAGFYASRPAAFIFFRDGKSLLQYQMEAVLATKPKYIPYVRLKKDYSEHEGDYSCSICCDGGNLLLCDHCPSAFHPGCVGLEDVPEGSWWCSSCRCHICGLSEFNSDVNQFTEKSVLYCDQCELGYHVGCLRKRGSYLLNSCPTGSWVCSKNCSKIFYHLQKSLGKANPTTVEGLSWIILRSSTGDITDRFDDETIAEYHSKLYIALDVLHECFEPLVESRTQSDVVADLLFNRPSELHRLNFRGFYTIILEKGDELVSVATFRIHGERVAEMPFIGTRFKFRHQGMCRLLVSELEKLLAALGVERLVLPAVPQLLHTWTYSFGFTQMTNSDRMELLEYSLLNFEDAFMCQKFLGTPSKMSEVPRGNRKSSKNTYQLTGTHNCKDDSEVMDVGESFEKSPSSRVDGTIVENSHQIDAALSLLNICFEDKMRDEISESFSTEECEDDWWRSLLVLNS